VRRKSKFGIKKET
jgi:hypothetical protein